MVPLLRARPLLYRYFHANYKKKWITPSTETEQAYKCFCEQFNKRIPNDAEPIDANIDIVRAVPEYRKHVLLVSDIDIDLKKPVHVWKDIWESRIEQNHQYPFDIIPKLNFGPGTLFNAISVVSSTENLPKPSEGVYDFIILPEMKLYRIRENDVANFNAYVNSGETRPTPKLSFNDYLSGEVYKKIEQDSKINESKVTDNYDLESLSLENKKWSFVCGHRKRDERCGLIAPEIVEKLSTLNEDMNLAIISHIGGHKYAGNVIFYLPHDTKDNAPHLDALWFGKVYPNNIANIVEELNNGVIIENNFRGGISL
ncbi:Altered inheritance of mitochondria protein 32 [Nakaseomyces bracarensis]|uniref:Altered inheritance of mitochondria protein 32 n=1 Tax=Nakaseomyces bracarensis TaxID=273131 RepID=A0ABR4NLQ2_9SACH